MNETPLRPELTAAHNARSRTADARGLVRLSFDAARMVTDVVEDVHSTILNEIGAPFARLVNGLPPPVPGRTGGLPRFVYRTIHAGYNAAEAALIATSDVLASAPIATPPLPESERLLAVLNGVWGHHLAASMNPLAIEMSLKHQGQPLVLGPSATGNRIPAAGGRLLVLVHGLCLDDSSWQQGGHDHGLELGRNLGYTPLYLHYNTGLHISTNGKLFADMLEALVDRWPQPVEELAIIGFSMGGLVARSAVHYGNVAGHRWVPVLKRIVFLGTPHQGSRLERVGNWVAGALDTTRYSAPFHRLGATRSAGITDLRHGSVLDEDWQGAPRSGPGHRKPRAVALPSGIGCYAAAATMGSEEGDAKDRMLGDGFVLLSSALGRHQDTRRSLMIPETRQWVGYRMKHLDLLTSPEVYEKLHEWLREPVQTQPPPS